MHVCSLFVQLDQSVVDNGPNRSRAPEVLERYCADLPDGYKGEKGRLARFILGMCTTQHAHSMHTAGTQHALLTCTASVLL